MNKLKVSRIPRKPMRVKRKKPLKRNKMPRTGVFIPKTRKRIRRIGRVGKANIEANKILRTKLGHITRCEMRLGGCLGGWLLQFAHRHKRIWYRGEVEKLSDVKQVIVACQNCHEKTENNRPLNREIFMKLRGAE